MNTMRISCAFSSASFEQVIKKRLVSYGHDTRDFDPTDLRESLPDAFIVHLESVNVIEDLIEVIKFRKSSDNERFPRIVILSPLSTWAGGSTSLVSSDNFLTRVPLAGAYPQYLRENALYSLGIQRRAEIFICGVGLVYGEGGIDFEGLFRAIHSDSKSFRVQSLKDGENVVPMVHCIDLANHINALLTSDAASCPVYSVASDGGRTKLAELLKKMGADFPYSDLDNAADMLCLTPTDIAWNFDLVTAAPPSGEEQEVEGGAFSLVPLEYPAGLPLRFKDVWAEFLSAHRLRPVSFVVAGPPGSGKTALAKALATRNGLQYIDMFSTVRFVFQEVRRPGESALKLSPSTLNVDEIKDPHARLRAELTRILETKLQDQAAASAGGKGGGAAAKKKDNTSSSEAAAAAGSGGSVDFTGPALTEELCASIPDDILRECVLLRLNKDPVCVRKGFVLDLWGQLIGGLLDFVAATRGLAQQQQGFAASSVSSASLSGSPEAAAAEEAEEADEPRPTTGQNLLAGGTQLLVELQAPDSALIMDRYQKAIGVDTAQAKPKLTKDQQESVKRMEGLLEAYRAQLRPCAQSSSSIAGEGTGQRAGAFVDAETRRRRNKIEQLAAAPEGSASHTGLLEIEGAGAVVVRAAIGAAISAEELADSLSAVYRDVFAAEEPLPSEPEASDSAGGGSGGSAVDSAAAYQRTADGFGSAARSKDFDSLNAELAPLGEDVIGQMQRRNNELQAFLVDNLMVHLGEMLVIIAREQPEDPLKFAYEFLEQRGLQAEALARQQARELFETSIAEARALEALVERDLRLAVEEAAQAES